MGEVFLEAEAFSHIGGWVVEQQSMEELHSAYLMAHGLGVPVEDAYTVFSLPEAGEYHIWALTRDWTAVWNVKDPAGKFRILMDGAPLSETLGTNGPAWGWQKAGSVYLEAGEHTLALHDLTGFNGRCDALYLTASPAVPSSAQSDVDALRKRLGWKEIENAAESCDLIVAGGGVAGICFALSASRLGVKTALIHDREVLGGCNSSEVRVCMGGQILLPPYPRLGTVVREIAPVMGSPKRFDAKYYEDDRKRLAFELGPMEGFGTECALLTSERVTDIETENGAIKAVITTHVRTGRKKWYRAKYFADCTGDGILARLCGCETMYGRDARSRFGESLAPEKEEQLVMGHSLRWYSREDSAPTPFPDIDWNLGIDDDTCLDIFDGDWEQETGFRRDMIHETEYIRDFGLRAIFSNWSWQKNRFRDKEKYRNRTLVWVSPLGGKRESCRVVGEHILTQQDIENHIIYPDASAAMTWSIDMHFPEPSNDAAFPEPFRSFAYHRGIVEPYPVPYRCMLPKGVSNLFLGGRILSTSHVAFSAIRVMRTLGALAEVGGMAASVCVEHGCTPMEVYSEHLGELKAKMEAGVPSPDAFRCGVDASESYHFKDLGWLHLRGWDGSGFSCDSPEKMDSFRRGVMALGLQHKYPLPDCLK